MVTDKNSNRRNKLTMSRQGRRHFVIVRFFHVWVLCAFCAGLRSCFFYMIFFFGKRKISFSTGESMGARCWNV